jgi:2'-5' RNA ligase
MDWGGGLMPAEEEAHDERPLILSLALDRETFKRLNEERNRHFPAERNYLDAHLTLFHKLPASRADETIAFLTDLAAQQAPIELKAQGYRFLGRGVALDFEAPALLALRSRIAARFAGDLSPQDQQKLKPHVTIQNKVEPAAAKELFQEKQASFASFTAQGTGLLLWRYDGGPWEEMKKFSFAGPAAPPAARE